MRSRTAPRKATKRYKIVAVRCLVVLLAVQLLYPGGRTRPLVQVAGRSYGFMNAERFDERLKATDDELQQLTLAKKSYQVAVKQIGGSTKVEQTRNQALRYDLKERLIPFSLFSRGRTNRTPERDFDAQKFNTFAENIIAENTTDAKNPEVFRTSDGNFDTKPGVQGSTYEPDTLKQALREVPFLSKERVRLPPDKKIQPTVSDERAKQVAGTVKLNEANLNKLIKDWQAERPAAQTAVSFQEIGGFGRMAQASKDTSFFAASLYKLFVAHYVFHGIEAKTINPAAPAVGGRDISGCLQAMIVISDNPCPEALANRFGWSAIDAFAASNGFGASNVEYGGNTVTAASVTDFLVRLRAGKLLNEEHTATLLGYMGRQIYRAGIPAGLPGHVVQDKVGFYGGTWHDAAIVQTKKATYVLVVLTNGASPSAIADLAKRIDALLEPTF